MSNAWVICLKDEDSPLKGGVIFDNTISLIFMVKDGLLLAVLSPLEEPASYQVVGGVKAYQA